MARSQGLLVLIGNDVPNAVAEFLHQRGHDVEFMREVFPLKTPDIVIALRADQLQTTIATCNCRHFLSILARSKPDGQLRYPRAGLIALACRQVDGRRRIEAFMYLIEADHAHILEKSIPRLIVEIRDSYFRVNR